ncbi:hypothetical protein HD597_010096 [Nonomuraea thailandensis]|uniref:Uncharacterized protein n=1 Tax=Nonomuraea thailandensis TaxID=1188745 RepID=A0A9X2GWJ9_9ACTN|nr:hypothetical protein [Nonomuraea thailandensis]MCP2363076.1 hypothetical protein [Nonomuraea thailandensis]
MSTIQPYTPADLARLRSVGIRPEGWSHRVKPRWKDGRRPKTGERVKVLLDELGNKVRMRQHGQDVKILNAATVVVGEIRADLVDWERFQ